MAFIWAGLFAVLALISYLVLTGSTTTGISSRKAQRAKAMKEAFKAIDQPHRPTQKVAAGENPDAMEISQLWIYPIKSIQGCQVSTAMLTQEGFYRDRRFMLLKDHEETPRKLENMHIAKFPSMCLFYPSINEENTLTVTYRPPGARAHDKADTLEIPFEPESLDSLERVSVNMHSSPTTGYNMGEAYNQWLSQRFGFKVILAYWGCNPRSVLGNLPGKPATQGPRSRNAATKILGSLPVLGRMLEADDASIAFNDCAPYLVIHEPSVADVSARLPPGVAMDPTKFRANVVVRGPAPAYAEDFWAELTCGEGGPRIVLTSNCGRCQSLNVDYHTGESGTGRDGEVLKLLQRDRRVDPGMKYSPIFGRYGFVARGDEGRVLSVGDEVVVSRQNGERTRFYWPGIST